MVSGPELGGGIVAILFALRSHGWKKKMVADAAREARESKRSG